MNELARALLGGRLLFRFFDWVRGFASRSRLVGGGTGYPLGFELAKLIPQAPSFRMLRLIVVWHDCSTRFHASVVCTFRSAQAQGFRHDRVVTCFGLLCMMLIVI